MDLKTKVNAENGKNEIRITREFELPVELLFKAYSEAQFIEQWMQNEVIKFENRKQGGYHFQKKDPQGNLIFEAHGVLHDYIQNKKIIRTFEMVNAPMGVQLEFLDFKAIDENRSKLAIRNLFETVEQRDELLKLPFAQGLSMAHDRLEQIANN